VKRLVDRVVKVFLPRLRMTPGAMGEARTRSLFALRDRKTGAILFLGRVADPTR
jgi:hypothetical protein